MKGGETQRASFMGQCADTRVKEAFVTENEEGSRLAEVTRKNFVGSVQAYVFNSAIREVSGIAGLEDICDRLNDNDGEKSTIKEIESIVKREQAFPGYVTTRVEKEMKLHKAESLISGILSFRGAAEQEYEKVISNLKLSIFNLYYKENFVAPITNIFRFWSEKSIVEAMIARSLVPKIFSPQQALMVVAAVKAPILMSYVTKENVTKEKILEATKLLSFSIVSRSLLLSWVFKAFFPASVPLHQIFFLMLQFFSIGSAHKNLTRNNECRDFLSFLSQKIIRDDLTEVGCKKEADEVAQLFQSEPKSFNREVAQLELKIQKIEVCLEKRNVKINEGDLTKKELKKNKSLVRGDLKSLKRFKRQVELEKLQNITRENRVVSENPVRERDNSKVLGIVGVILNVAKLYLDQKKSSFDAGLANYSGLLLLGCVWLVSRQVFKNIHHLEGSNRALLAIIEKTKDAVTKDA